MRAGSEPTSGSVSAKADTAPLAQRGKYFFFCSSVPNILTGCGTPIDWCAESQVTIEDDAVPAIAIALPYEYCESPRPPYSVGILMPKAPRRLSPSMTEGGTLPVSPVSSASTSSRRKRSSASRKGRARFSSSGSGSGWGWMSPRSSRPRNSSRTNDGCAHSVSREASAIALASPSLGPEWVGRVEPLIGKSPLMEYRLGGRLGPPPTDTQRRVCHALAGGTLADPGRPGLTGAPQATMASQPARPP